MFHQKDNQSETPLPAGHENPLEYKDFPSRNATVDVEKNYPCFSHVNDGELENKNSSKDVTGTYYQQKDSRWSRLRLFVGAFFLLSSLNLAYRGFGPVLHVVSLLDR